MPNYIKISPDPDSKKCRCTPGDPDCDHLESCPECGEEFAAVDGHDCLDGVTDIEELRQIAKDLRDSLDGNGPGNVLVALSRPEGYGDVHPDLILEDAHIHPAFRARVVGGAA